MSQIWESCTRFWRQDSFLVTIMKRKMLIFGDEVPSRRHFCPGNPLFWRRDLFSSSFLHGKPPFLATRPLLVVILKRKTPFFGDEALSRRHFCTGNPIFWRRDPFSSSLLPGKPHFLATRPFLVVIFARETPFFGDETFSRRHFCTGNSLFWRRDPFSSSLLPGKPHFLATRPFLVITFARETPFFGDETLSRHHFCPGNPIFWRRDPFSSSLLPGKPHFLATRPFLVITFARETPFFGDETLSRHHFCPGNPIFWRRDPFSSSLLPGKPHFLATRPFLVITFARETPFFGDETLSRHHFCPGNPIFWRRDLFSSSFLHGKPPFLATRPFLVVIFARETPFFGDEILSRHHFCPGNPIFWRRDPFSSSF